VHNWPRTSAAAAASSTGAAGALGIGAGLTAGAAGAAALEGLVGLSLGVDLVSLGLASALAASSLDDALNSARKALKDPKSDCSKLFSKGNGLDLLNKLAKKGKIRIGDTGIPKALSPTGRLTGAPGIGAYAKDAKIFLNPASSIVKGTLNPGAAVFGGMSSADALGTLIIHELRHLTGDLASEPLEFYRQESLLNSRDVKVACFPNYKP